MPDQSRGENLSSCSETLAALEALLQILSAVPLHHGLYSVVKWWLNNILVVIFLNSKQVK